MEWPALPYGGGQLSPDTLEALRLFRLAHLKYQQALRVRIAESQAHLALLRSRADLHPVEAPTVVDADIEVPE